MAKQKLGAVQKMIQNKKKLIERLNNEIADARKDCREEVRKIRFRIKIAKALLGALDK